MIGGMVVFISAWYHHRAFGGPVALALGLGLAAAVPAYLAFRVARDPRSGQHYWWTALTLTVMRCVAVFISRRQSFLELSGELGRVRFFHHLANPLDWVELIMLVAVAVSSFLLLRAISRATGRWA